MEATIPQDGCHKARREASRVLCSLCLVYSIASVAVFDYRTASLPPDEDNDSSGNPVAVGPRLWPWVNWSGKTSFEGNEWPFRVFYPICRAWIKLRGYSLPIEYR